MLNQLKPNYTFLCPNSHVIKVDVIFTTQFVTVVKIYEVDSCGLGCIDTCMTWDIFGYCA